MKKTENLKTASPENGLLRVELNFLKLPIFTFDRKKVGAKESIAIELEEKRGEEKVKIRLLVEPDYEHGLGGPFDFQAFRVIEKLLSDVYARSGGKIHKPVKLGNERTILRMLGYKRPCETDYKRLKEFFYRVTKLRLFSEFSVYNSKRKRWANGIKALEPIYEGVVFTYEKMPEDDPITKTIPIADAIYLWPSDMYLDNLNNKFTAIFNYTFYNSIESIVSRRLYELISLYSHRYNNVFYWYSELCTRMQITRQPYLSLARKNLKPHYEELIKKGFLTAVHWPDEDTNLRSTKDDWLIRFSVNQNPSLPIIAEISLPYQEVLKFDAPIVKTDLSQVAVPSVSEELLDFFSEAFYMAKKTRPAINKQKDAAVFEELLQTFPQENLQGLIEQFFKSADSFITGSIYSVGTFRSVINKLAIERQKELEESGLLKKKEEDGFKKDQQQAELKRELDDYYNALTDGEKQKIDSEAVEKVKSQIMIAQKIKEEGTDKALSSPIVQALIKDERNKLLKEIIRGRHGSKDHK